MAEVSQAWLERVKRAQQMAAERSGVDVSVMLPPRDGSTGEGQEPAPTSEVAATQPEPTVVAAVEAPVPQTQPASAPVAEAALPETIAAAETPAEDSAATIAAQAPSAVQSNGSAAAAAAERVAPVGRAAGLYG